jgi:Na+/H+ antiporter NhaD/arsenite permease-like protein
MRKCTRLLGCLLLLFPVLGSAGMLAEPRQLDLTHHWAGYFSAVVMVLAYIAAMLEEETFLRKSKPMLLGASLVWFVISLTYRQQGDVRLAVEAFDSNLLAFIELMLFIMVSMTYLNAMEDMRVFEALKNWLVAARFGYRKLFWITGFLVFALSSLVNGLTTGLLMGAVVMAVGKDNPRFVSLACINIVVAANAGGAFSPLGGISTLFVWQKGMVGFGQFFSLFIPCLVNFLVPAAIMHFSVPKACPVVKAKQVKLQSGAFGVILLFGVTIALAVVFDMLLGLPPAGGMMVGLSLLQFYSYYLQRMEQRNGAMPVQTLIDSAEPGLFLDAPGSYSYDIFEKIGRLEWDTLLFFYGAMMGIGGLGFIGYLDAVSHWLYGQHDPSEANVLIGLSSAFVDNGTLMFAVLNMNPNIPQGQWLLLTLTLGVGGSLLAIGSAPGIGLLGLTRGRYSFMAHLKWFPVILLGYFASIGVHFLVNSRFF